MSATVLGLGLIGGEDRKTTFYTYAINEMSWRCSEVARHGKQKKQNKVKTRNVFMWLAIKFRIEQWLCDLVLYCPIFEVNCVIRGVQIGGRTIGRLDGQTVQSDGP